MSRNQELLIILNKEYGDGTDDPLSMLKDAVHDSVCPGICRICEGTFEEVEPDQDCGWCEHCNENSVISCLVLAGLI
jgi:hypothetical protein